MSPEAKIWVPEGVSEKDLKNLLNPIGGRVDKFQEFKPIPVEKISSSSMVAFLRKSHPGLEFGQRPTYSKIFDRLRELPAGTQENLLVAFYTNGVKDFPNGEELGKYLARINNISWFQPKSQPDENLLKDLSRQVLSRLNLNPLPLRIIEEDWDAAQDAAQDAARGAAQDAARGAAWDAARGAAQDAAWDAARDAARGAARDVTWDAARGAEWIVVNDLMPQKGYDKGNPFKLLMEIYGLGCWPIGPVLNPTTREKEFLVFIPPIQKTA